MVKGSSTKAKVATKNGTVTTVMTGGKKKTCVTGAQGKMSTCVQKRGSSSTKKRRVVPGTGTAVGVPKKTTHARSVMKTTAVPPSSTKTRALTKHTRSPGKKKIPLDQKCENEKKKKSGINKARASRSSPNASSTSGSSSSSEQHHKWLKKKDRARSSSASSSSSTASSSSTSSHDDDDDFFPSFYSSIIPTTATKTIASKVLTSPCSCFHAPSSYVSHGEYGAAAMAETGSDSKTGSRKRDAGAGAGAVSVKTTKVDKNTKKASRKAPLLGPAQILKKDGSVNLTLLTDSDDPLSQERFWSLRKGKRVVDRDGDSIVFAYREGRFIRGLTLESLAMLTAHGTKTRDVLHPGSQVPIPPQDLKRGLECVRHYLEETKQGKKELTLEAMALEIFHAFSRISIFLDEKEFLRLNAINLRMCLHELTDMFAHNFTIDQRKLFFPPDGIMMHAPPSHSVDLGTWQRCVLSALRPLCLPNDNIPANLQNMGLYVALGALSVVCREFRKRYDAFSYEFFLL